MIELSTDAKVRGLAVAAYLCLAAAGVRAQDAEPAAPAPPSPPGREVSLPASEVKDTFFAYILGIIRAGAEIDIDNEAMRAILVELKSGLNLPFDLISRVSQRKDPESEARVVALEFQHDVAIPIPFSILFYHPGRITSTRLLSFDVGRSPWADPAFPAEPGEAFDLALSQGSILVEIDGWLKVLFGLEDTWIRHIVFFRWHGDWIGMLEGNARSSDRVKRAYFDFTKNTILFPPSDLLKSAGSELVPSSSP
ncbi:MAG TPA: hypothetical protein VFB30_01945 [Spirochaetia bacterium]|nr:hypothetical protein [Spirochaetia bacterium]